MALIGSNEVTLKDMALGPKLLGDAREAGHLGLGQERLKSKPHFAKINDAYEQPIGAAGDADQITRESWHGRPQLQPPSVNERANETPLHDAVENGELDRMMQLLSARPESVQETTTRGHTALHLAVKNGQTAALRKLVEHLEEHNMEEVINLKDYKGKTALSLAADLENVQAVEIILDKFTMVVKANANSRRGRKHRDSSPRGAGEVEITQIPAQAGAMPGRGRSSQPSSSTVSAADQSDGDAALSSSRIASGNSNGERESKADIRNALLVVAVLIATTTWQTVLQAPKFNIDVDPTHTRGFLAGYASWMTGFYGRELAYIVFMTGNTFGFLVSVQMIISLTRDLDVKLPVLLSMALMVQSYYSHAYYLPFQSLEKKFSLKNAELLSVLPLTIPILLLLFHGQLEKVLGSYLRKLF